MKIMLEKNMKKNQYDLPEKLYDDLQENDGLVVIKNEGQDDVAVISLDKYQEQLDKLASLQYLEKMIEKAIDIEQTDKLTFEEEQQILYDNHFVQINLFPDGYEDVPFLYVKNYYCNENGEMKHYWIKMNSSFKAIIQALAMAQRWGKPLLELNRDEREDILEQLHKIVEEK